MGIANRDFKSLQKGIQKFENKSVKRKIRDSDSTEEVISFAPSIYAKIAWRNGMLFDPESKYLPIELLRIEPLQEYIIPYWFLRDFYRKQGVDWRYDPIHPELQDWKNDREHTGR